MRFDKDDSNSLRVKLCGLTSLQQVHAFAQAGGWAAGFIFVPGSKRYVPLFDLDEKDVKAYKGPLEKVGVFANATYDVVMRTVDAYGLTLVQLHGEEPPELCRQLGKHVKIIKALPVSGEEIPDCAAYFDVSDYILLDTKTRQGWGGTGTQWNWSLLDTLPSFPYIISGGIGPGDESKILAMPGDHVFAIDINSRFETAPGLKNMDAVNKFMQNLNVALWKK